MYAGTNRGVYVTFDDGGWWQELNPGLTDVPVTDVIAEHDELAMVSHGRGFWGLHNVGSLRQRQGAREGVPGTAERDLVLFDPAMAYRSGGEVVLAWWVGEGIGSTVDAKLEVIDATGRGVRAFKPAGEAEERDRWNRSALPGDTGLWGVRTMAPAVPPGRYGVRVTVGELLGRLEGVWGEELREVNEGLTGVGVGGIVSGAQGMRAGVGGKLHEKATAPVRCSN